jgi:protein-S-isoprenylcysteine O-methyltransferase Ste14
MDIRNLFFKSRSFTPIPILLMMLYFARPNSPYFFLGIVLIVIGEIIRLRSVSFAGGETRTMNVGASSICKSGPYSIVRNPLYIGNMMIYVGFAFIAGSVYVVTISSITFVYFFIQYSLIISLEEEALEEKFGDEYIAYKNLVPSILPKINNTFRNYDTIPSSLAKTIKTEKRTLQNILLVSLLLFLRIKSF